MRRFRQLQDQNQKIACLKEALETRKIIERAKGILMDQHGMTEQDAFRYIHFKARSQNKKMREIAEGILAEPDKV
jgi:response regulator NasT